MTYGMNFGSKGVVNDPEYTTTRRRLQIDLNHKTKLFDVLDMNAGTNATVLTGNVFTEQLFFLEHGLGYIPQVFVSFQISPKVPGGSSPYYAINLALLAEGGIGSDFITYSIDEESFSINHIIDLTPGSFESPPISFTSTAGNLNLRLKYLICNNKQIHSINFQ